MTHRSQAVIVSAVKTPMGSFDGGLRPVPASGLGRRAVAEVLKRLDMRSDRAEESSNRLPENSIRVLRRAQHDRKAAACSMTASFVLRSSKDERRVFPQPARGCVLSVGPGQAGLHRYRYSERCRRDDREQRLWLTPHDGDHGRARRPTWGSQSDRRGRDGTYEPRPLPARESPNRPLPDGGTGRGRPGEFSPNWGGGGFGCLS